MADSATKEKKAAPKADSGQSTQQAGPQFQLLGQYIRDFSFECPQPPHTMSNAKTEMGFNVMVNSNKLDGDNYEVVIGLRGENKTDKGDTVYLVELQYAGLFNIKGFSQDQLHMLIGVEAPSLLFPFARNLFMSVIMEAGFRPPMIDPINFHALYMQQQEQQKKQAGAAKA